MPINVSFMAKQLVGTRFLQYPIANQAACWGDADLQHGDGAMTFLTRTARDDDGDQGPIALTTLGILVDGLK